MVIRDNEIHKAHNIKDIDESITIVIDDDKISRSIKNKFSKRFEEFSDCHDYKNFRKEIRGKNFIQFALYKYEKKYLLQAYIDSYYYEDECNLEISEEFFYELLEFVKNKIYYG